MRSLKTFTNIYLCRRPVDGRKQINGLSQVITAELRGDPFAGDLFVFVGKKRDQVRILYWDLTGFAMWVKRLEKNRFRWPLALEEEVVQLTSKELAWLLDGIDILKTRAHKPLNYRQT